MQKHRPITLAHEITPADVQTHIRSGAELAFLGKSEEGVYQFPAKIATITAGIQSVVIKLKSCGTVLAANENLGGKRKDELKLIAYSEKLDALCGEIIRPTNKLVMEQNATIEEFFKLIKQAPKLVAAATGYTLEQLAQPKLKDQENPFIPLFTQLAEARDGIQKEMNFRPELTNKIHLTATSNFVISGAIVISIMAICGLAGLIKTPNLIFILVTDAFICLARVAGEGIRQVCQSDMGAPVFFRVEETKVPDHIEQFQNLAWTARKAVEKLKGVHHG